MLTPASSCRASPYNTGWPSSTASALSAMACTATAPSATAYSRILPWSRLCCFFDLFSQSFMHACIQSLGFGSFYAFKTCWQILPVLMLKSHTSSQLLAEFMLGIAKYTQVSLSTHHAYRVGCCLALTNATVPSRHQCLF